MSHTVKPSACWYVASSFLLTWTWSKLKTRKNTRKTHPKISSDETLIYLLLMNRIMNLTINVETVNWWFVFYHGLLILDWFQLINSWKYNKSVQCTRLHKKISQVPGISLIINPQYWHRCSYWRDELQSLKSDISIEFLIFGRELVERMWMSLCDWWSPCSAVVVVGPSPRKSDKGVRQVGLSSPSAATAQATRIDHLTHHTKNTFYHGTRR